MYKATPPNVLQVLLGEISQISLSTLHEKSGLISKKLAKAVVFQPVLTIKEILECSILK